MHFALSSRLKASLLASLLIGADLVLASADQAAAVLHSFSSGVANGVLYKIDAQKNFSILHIFQDWQNGDGSLPNRLLVAADRSILGLTASGGTHADGTVYRVELRGVGLFR